VGDVQRVESQGAGPFEEFADLLGFHADRIQVNRPIEVLEPLRASLGHMQRRGQRGPDTGPDESD
jgi:hypothetical protein